LDVDAKALTSTDLYISFEAKNKTLKMPESGRMLCTGAILIILQLFGMTW
jgi:hypothetical protein